MTPNPLREATLTLNCERLLKVGHIPGTEASWLVRLMVSRAVYYGCGPVEALTVIGP